MRVLVFVLSLAIAAGCVKKKEVESSRPRVELRRVDNDRVELWPLSADFPFCLVFSIGQSGFFEQRTLNPDGSSLECKPGKPISGHSFRVSLDEGLTRFIVILSDQPLSAVDVAEQLDDLGKKPALSALDLSLPGRVALESLAFTPEARSGSGAAPRASSEDPDEASPVLVESQGE